MKSAFLIILLLLSLILTGCPGLEEIIDLDPQNPKLHISIEGEGSVSPNQGTYEKNEIVHLQVTPGKGWTFSHWICTHSQDVEPVQVEEGQWKIVMDSDKHLTAVFVPLTYELHITIYGQGSVHHGIKVSPQYHEYEADMVLSLVGLPEEGWDFSHFEGDLNTTDNPATLIMDDHKWIDAYFTSQDEDEHTGIINGTARFSDKEDHSKIQITAQGEGVQKITFTDEEGNFTFKDLPTTNLYIEAHHDGYFPTSITFLSVNGETRSIDEVLYLYPLQTYGHVEGHAFFIDRENHKDIAINIRTLEGKELPNLIALTDEDGYFYFDKVPVDPDTDEETYIFTASSLREMGYGTDSIRGTVYRDTLTTLDDELWLRPSAAEVIIFADDSTPWNSNALFEMLDLLEADYSIHSSDEMATLPLPIDKTVWIINDQYQSFYDAYAASQERFDNFVVQGGTLLFEACDQGWNGGSIKGAGATLPGDVINELRYDNNNYNVNPTHPMMTAVPMELYGTYASHNYFVNLPEISTILCEDNQGNPTLVEYKYGQGRVIATGQPLEFNWNNAQNLRQIYANMIFYTFNQPIQVLFPEGDPVDSKVTRDSSGL